jgi:hypothetical protein
MSEADIAARLVDDLAAFAVKTAAHAALASVAIDVLSAGDIALVEVRVERQTRTLLFLSADARDTAGARIASASSVHKLLS